MIASYLFGVFSLVFCIVFCWFRSEKPTVYSLCLKTVASMSFVLCGIFSIEAVGDSSISLLIIVGLVFGLIGDILLDLKIMYPEQSNQYFVSGTIAFSVGHFFYFFSAILYNGLVLPNNLLWNILASLGVAIILTVLILFSAKKMNMDFGKMIYLVIMYSFILTFMIGFSVSIAIFNPIYWIFAVGMILFLASDLILSMQYFGNKSEKIWIYVNHILYYLAQILLAISILFIVQ